MRIEQILFLHHHREDTYFREFPGPTVALQEQEIKFHFKLLRF